MKKYEQRMRVLPEHSDKKQPVSAEEIRGSMGLLLTQVMNLEADAAVDTAGYLSDRIART
ncbi:MAG: hypothetical protein NC409_02505 [Clostridium sp.]|nr:hypothetical protein [Clostridium sp.]